ncbi:MAG: hypothetical protein LBN12_04835 [Clostridiales Family XIII bacterium]|jgi:flagellar biosynthesis chaperone FliJ|nr:hypothetical protein [Clostridiales Family XIII bacterium]
MSQLQQLISQVSDAERQIKEQIGKLESFKSANDKLLDQIAEGLSGSAKGHDQRMQAQIEQTKSQIDKTIGQLQQTEAALQRARMI